MQESRLLSQKAPLVKIHRKQLYLASPEMYESKLRFLSHTVGRTARAVSSMKKVLLSRGAPKTVMEAPGKSEDRLSPSRIRNSTQQACVVKNTWQ